MAFHLYDNPGPKSTKTVRSDIGDAVTTTVTLYDGNDHLALQFSDLDTLNELVVLVQEARANHVAELCAGHSETVEPGQLKGDDVIVLGGELVFVNNVMVDRDTATVRYARKYRGLWDLTDLESVSLPRRQSVQRLLPAAVS